MDSKLRAVRKRLLTDFPFYAKASLKIRTKAGEIANLKLNPAQKILQEAVDESVDFQRKLWNETEEDVLRQLREAGIEIHSPDKEPFREKVKQMYEEFKGDELYDLIQEIKKVE